MNTLEALRPEQHRRHDCNPIGPTVGLRAGRDDHRIEQILADAVRPWLAALPFRSLLRYQNAGSDPTVVFFL